MVVRYRGRTSYSVPADLWAYQEIISDKLPEYIVEVGTSEGACTNFLADMCQTLNGGRVISVDVQWLDTRPAHPRIIYLHGKSVLPEIQNVIRETVGNHTCMVILDSDVADDRYVLQELEAYGPMVTPGQHLIVCRTSNEKLGSVHALRSFLKSHQEFEPDRAREYDGTQNPGGYLRRRLA